MTPMTMIRSEYTNMTPNYDKCKIYKNDSKLCYVLNILKWLKTGTSADNTKHDSKLWYMLNMKTGPSAEHANMTPMTVIRSEHTNMTQTMICAEYTNINYFVLYKSSVNLSKIWISSISFILQKLIKNVYTDD